MKDYLAPVLSLSKSRKFWVGVLAAAANGVLVFVTNQPELAPYVSLLCALGIYHAPNAD